MTEPVASDELTQGVKDAQAKFDEGMGADGDASPYPMLAELAGVRPPSTAAGPRWGYRRARTANSRSSRCTPSTR